MISDKQVTSKQKYKNLKRKLKLLLYEQECFLDELRKSERKMIKVQRDKNFLLDRLLQFERVDDSSDETDSTMSSGESDSELPSFSNSRTASASKQERGSPAAVGAYAGSGGSHFPFAGQPSMDLSPASMLSASMPHNLFGNMHQQGGQYALNTSMNGPGAMGGQRLVSGSPAAPRGRGRPRAGGAAGVARGGGGGRGTRGRGAGAGPAGLSSSSSGPGSNSGGLVAGMTLGGPQGTPSRGNSANGNYASTSNQQASQLNSSISLGSPTQGSSSGMMSGDMGSSFPLFSPENSGNSGSFMPPQQQQPQQRYTPQPPQQMPGMVNPQQQSGSLTPTGQQPTMMYSGQQTPNQLQPNVGLMGPPQPQQQPQQFLQPQMGLPTTDLLEGVMTHEDVERCLESSGGPDRFLYERIPGDLPADIFSENSEDDGVGGIGNSVSSEA